MNSSYTQGLVSVIIPTYKRSNTLSRAITSVKNQTYKNIEILVVDDNEPGDEFSISVASLIESLNYENVLLITQKKHINGAAARNAGIRTANGEYIAFLDDDDLWLPEKVEKQIEYLKTTDDTVAGVSTRKIYFKNDQLTHASEKWSYFPKQNFDIISRRLNVSTCTILVKHEALDNSGYFDETLRRNQEVQLLAFLTSKYKLECIDDFLTVIDCSDISNRPSAQKLLDYKTDYFKAILPVLSQYSNHKQQLVKAHNMTEVSWAFFRDGYRLKGIMMLIHSIRYPSVFIAFLKRFLSKRKNQKMLNSVLENKRSFVKTMIMS